MSDGLMNMADQVDLSFSTPSPVPSCSTFARLRISFTSFMLSFSDRSGCKVVDYWVNCKGCKCLAHLDTVGVCGSNPHAPIVNKEVRGGESCLFLFGTTYGTTFN